MGFELLSRHKRTTGPSLAARYLEKKTRLFFDFLRPPVPVSPGLPEDDPTIDKNKRAGLKKWID